MKALFSRVHARLGDLWWYTILLFVAQRFGDFINMFVGLWIVPKYVPMEELGAMPPRQLRNLQTFIDLRTAELELDWKLCMEGKDVIWIDSIR